MATILVVTILLVCFGSPASAQTKPGSGPAWRLTRTPDGQPDLQGVWVSNRATPLERPAEYAQRPLLTDAEVAEFQKRYQRIFMDGGSSYAGADAAFNAASQNRDRVLNAGAMVSSVFMIDLVFDNRTSQVIDPPDGRIPPVTLEGQKKRAAQQAKARQLPESAEDLGNAQRCITWGVPRIGTYGVGPFAYNQIFQGPGYFVLLMEQVHQARIIPLDGRPHLPQSLRQWDGDSRGRWEGDTLVVDTTNFSPKSNFMASSDNLHLTERFKRVAADRIEYTITVDDPTMWTKPWTVMIVLGKTTDPIHEFACHEGDYSTPGTLSAARAEEKKAAATTPQR